MPRLDDEAVTIAIRGAALLCALAILLGPFYTDPGYDWTRHSVSELAGQSTSNAWIMRAGLLAVGLGTVYGFFRRQPRYNIVLLLFGISIAMTAVFPHRPFNPDMPYSEGLDQLHSLFASLGGFLAVVGFVIRAFQPGSRLERGIAAFLAILFSVLSAAMFYRPDYQGLFQRGIFGPFLLWMVTLGAARADQ